MTDTGSQVARCSDCTTTTREGALYWCYWCNVRICATCVRFHDIGLNTRASMCKACYRREIGKLN